ncbi:hypothetical protein, partial [Enterovibrio norvegicus]|uniref:hypothetical protein n=1 Tax=Enterovibrio norvegicus TaxID=188144 RepID=UPI001056BFDD
MKKHTLHIISLLFSLLYTSDSFAWNKLKSWGYRVGTTCSEITNIEEIGAFRSFIYSVRQQNPTKTISYSLLKKESVPILNCYVTVDLFGVDKNPECPDLKYPDVCEPVGYCDTQFSTDASNAEAQCIANLPPDMNMDFSASCHADTQTADINCLYTPIDLGGGGGGDGGSG